MKVLAIDPGNVQSAYIIWDGSRNEKAAIIPNLELTLMLDAIAHMPNSVDYVAIEKIASYGMAVGESVFETCVWTGRFMQAWLARRSNESLIRIPRKEVCVNLCGSVRAKDANIRQALIDRLGAPGTKKEPGVTHGIAKDLWSSLAVAVTVFDRLKVGYYK